MTPLTTKLKRIRDLLNTVSGVSVYHYKRPPNLSGCVVWSETYDDGTYDYADDKVYEQIVHGRIEFWTKKEYDPAVDSIQEALNSNSRVGWRLNDVDYEDETGLIYYQWDFTVV